MDELIASKQDIEIFSCLDDFTAILMDTTAELMSRLMDRSDKKVKQLTEAMAGLKDYIDFLTREAKTNKAAAAKAMAKLKETDECSDCYMPFIGYVDTLDGYISSVRCKNCFERRFR